jgi:hypothetical protein
MNGRKDSVEDGGDSALVEAEPDIDPRRNYLRRNVSVWIFPTLSCSIRIHCEP